MDLILLAVIVLGVLGLVSALVLFYASHRFAVHEDPRIGQVAAVLPQANCGGCGYPGCSGFAAACVKAADQGSLDGKLCPVGGQAVMEQVADIVGLSRQTAVLAYCFGDGFSDMFWPTNCSLQCGLMGIPLNRWYRFITPLFFIMVVLQFLFMGISVYVF